MFAVHAGGVGCRYDTHTHKWDRRPTHVTSRGTFREYTDTRNTHTIMTNDKNELEENEDESEDLEVK